MSKCFLDRNKTWSVDTRQKFQRVVFCGWDAYTTCLPHTGNAYIYSNAGAHCSDWETLDSVCWRIFTFLYARGKNHTGKKFNFVFLSKRKQTNLKCNSRRNDVQWRLHCTLISLGMPCLAGWHTSMIVFHIHQKYTTGCVVSLTVNIGKGTFSALHWFRDHSALILLYKWTQKWNRLVTDTRNGFADIIDSTRLRWNEMELDATRTDSVRSVESGYVSVDAPDLRKCNVCDSPCPEPIVAWFSRQNGSSTTSRNSRSLLIEVGQLCEGCFNKSPITAKDEKKRHSIIQRYNRYIVQRITSTPLCKAPRLLTDNKNLEILVPVKQEFLCCGVLWSAEGTTIDGNNNPRAGIGVGNRIYSYCCSLSQTNN